MSRVLIPLAEGCEELEAITLIDLLRRAGIEVTVAGLAPGPVAAAHGVRITPDTTLDEAGTGYDMIVLPGGLPGADHLDADPRIRDLLREQSGSGGKVGAICAAPKVLASAGLLEGKRATCYPGCIEEQRFPSTTFTGAPVEVDGAVLTSRGPGTAIDFALAVIESLEGKTCRDEVEAQLVRPRAA